MSAVCFCLQHNDLVLQIGEKDEAESLYSHGVRSSIGGSDGKKKSEARSMRQAREFRGLLKSDFYDLAKASTMSFNDVSGALLHYQVLGQGPILLLIHGARKGSQIFNAIFDRPATSNFETKLGRIEVF